MILSSYFMMQIILLILINISIKITSFSLPKLFSTQKNQHIIGESLFSSFSSSLKESSKKLKLKLNFRSLLGNDGTFFHPPPGNSY